MFFSFKLLCKENCLPYFSTSRVGRPVWHFVLSNLQSFSGIFIFILSSLSAQDLASTVQNGFAACQHFLRLLAKNLEI